MTQLDIRTDRLDSKPICEQISQQIRQVIGVGALTDGDTLPTVNELANQLGVSKLTVFKAYVELQRDGLLDCRARCSPVVNLHAPGRNLSHEGQFLDGSSLMSNELYQGQAETLSLATALPDPALFQKSKFIEYFQSLNETDRSTFEVPEREGELYLREQGAALLRHVCEHWGVEDVFVTPGLMSGQKLTVTSVVGRGNHLAVQDPSWPGMYALNDQIGVRAHPVPQTTSGLDTELLEFIAVEKNIRALMVSPDHAWGNGLSLPVDNRLQILELAEKHGFTIIETVGQSRIHFSGRPLPSFSALAEGSDRVVSEFDLCTCLSAELGIGLLALKGENRRLALDVFKASAQPAIPLQLAVAAFLEDDQFESHLGKVIPAYRTRKEAMVRALKSALPKGCRWTEPSGGYVLEVSLPGVDVDKLLKAATTAGLSIVPSAACSSLPGAEEQIRLSFSMLTPERIVRAVVSLARLIKEQAKV